VIPSKAWSQKKAEIIKTRWAEKSIEVNGILSDWKDSLDLYNADTKLFYSIANDHENIYLAVKNSSEDNLTKILARGISFTVNFENTKKIAPTVTFPVLDRTPGKKQVEIEQPEAKEIQRRIISKIKEIKVEGFKELVDGGISLYNTYGIKAAMSFDEKNNMIQEIAIPLRLLGIESGSTELITYRIRINGFQGSASIQQRDMNDYDDLYGGTYGDRFNRRSGRNYNGMYGGMPRRNYLSTNTTNSTEFFIKSALAAKQN
jgi:lipoprotein-anchoring transpeptidase ErfK/SrfK